MSDNRTAEPLRVAPVGDVLLGVWFGTELGTASAQRALAEPDTYPCEAIHQLQMIRGEKAE